MAGNCVAGEEKVRGEEIIIPVSAQLHIKPTIDIRNGQAIETKTEQGYHE